MSQSLLVTTTASQGSRSGTDPSFASCCRHLHLEVEVPKAGVRRPCRSLDGAQGRAAPGPLAAPGSTVPGPPGARRPRVPGSSLLEAESRLAAAGPPPPPTAGAPLTARSPPNRSGHFLSLSGQRLEPRSTCHLRPPSRKLVHSAAPGVGSWISLGTVILLTAAPPRVARAEAETREARGRGCGPRARAGGPQPPAGDGRRPSPDPRAATGTADRRQRVRRARSA